MDGHPLSWAVCDPYVTCTIDIGFEWPVDIPVKRLQLVTRVRRKERTVTPLSFMHSRAAIDKCESRISNKRTAGLSFEVFA
jgi:hypothetical protein